MKERLHLAEQILQARMGEPTEPRARVYFVPRGKGRRLAISDIHGCLNTFRELLLKVGLNKDDQLFLLGDFVSRGPYSRLTVKYIKSLIVDGYQIYPLRGNHEQLYLDFNRSSPHKLGIFAERQNAAHLMKLQDRLWPGMDRFFGTLPYYFETDHHLLVHAGFDSAAKKPLKAWHHMLWARQFTYDMLHYEGKRIIHGHVPHHIKRIEEAAAEGARICPIDNGCIRAGKHGFGRLVCLDIDSGMLWKKKNSDSYAIAEQ